MELKDLGTEVWEFLKREFGDFSGYNAQIFSSCAPGRANIIGEHTDYNMGFVLPFAVNLKTFAFLRKRRDKTVRVASLNLKHVFVTTLDDLGKSREQAKSGEWWKYVLGPAYILLDHIDSGFELVVFGNIPLGGGISSSASVQVAVTVVLHLAFSLKLDKFSIARVAKDSENIFVGVPCGIMDQIASVFGRRNHALIINCKTLDIDYVRVPDEISFVLCDSGVRHSLASSEYAIRRRECESALKMIKEKYEIESLSDIKPDMLQEIKNIIPEHLFKRVRFVAEENARVKEMFRIFHNYDDRYEERIRELFSQSHNGLRYDYEVSCRELDLLFEIALMHPGTIASRMMGGGFGGNTINLVKKGYEEDFSEFVKAKYKEMTGISPRVIHVYPDDGASELYFEDIMRGNWRI